MVAATTIEAIGRLNAATAMSTYIVARKEQIKLLTFSAFGKTNNVCNAEGQTDTNNQEIISLEPNERKYPKHNPSNSLH